jgi:hypothetical protein
MLVGSQARYGICPIKVMDTYTVFVLYMKTVTIDGGLLPFEAGSFNDLVEVTYTLTVAVHSHVNMVTYV